MNPLLFLEFLLIFSLAFGSNLDNLDDFFFNEIILEHDQSDPLTCFEESQWTSVSSERISISPDPRRSDNESVSSELVPAGSWDDINKNLMNPEDLIRDFLTAEEQYGIDEHLEIEFVQDDAMAFSSTIEILLNRFKVESGWSHANYIDWEILDRSKIPSEYDPVMINSVTIKLARLYKNPEIVSNIHFKAYSEEILNSKRSYKRKNGSRMTGNNEAEAGGGQSCDNFESDCGSSDGFRDSIENSVSDVEILAPLDSFEKVSDRYLISEENQDITDKIQSVFNLQFPDGGEFNFERFNAMNWPSSVTRSKSKWNRKEIKTLKKCVNGLIFERIDKSIKYDTVKGILLNRFRAQTDHPFASCIEWKFLDRSKVPKKFDSFVIDSATIRWPKIYKKPEIIDNINFYRTIKCVDSEIMEELNELWDLPDITEVYETSEISEIMANSEYDLFNDPDQTKDIKKESKLIEDQELEFEIQRVFSLQFPTEGAFSFHRFDIENWPPSIKKNKTKWSRECIDILKRSVNDFVFVRIEESISLQGVKDMLLDGFRVETGFFDGLGDSPSPTGTNEEIDSNGLVTEQTLLKSWEEIDSEAYADDPMILGCTSIQSYRNRSMMNEFKKRFSKEFPGKKFSFRHYNVINWPQEVPKTKIPWSLTDLEIIRCSLNNFRFIRREKPLALEIKSRSIENSVGKFPQVNSMTFHSSMKVILNRFGKESGWPQASIINWHLLDRSQIPSKYDQVIINGNTMKLSKVFKNPEIVDNIHFHKYTKKQLDMKLVYEQRRRQGSGSMSGEEGEHDLVKEFEAVLESVHSPSEGVCDTNNGGERGFSDQEDDVKEGASDSNSSIDVTKNPPDVAHDYFLKVLAQTSTNFERNRLVLEEIQRVFNLQFPDEGEFTFKRFDVLNWPASLKKVKHIWSCESIEILKNSVKDFIFVKIYSPVSFENVKDKILNRFRAEVECPNATVVEWNLIDRSRLPIQYQSTLINGLTIKLTKIYRNSEIIDNLHFVSKDPNAYTTKDLMNIYPKNTQNGRLQRKRTIQPNTVSNKKSKLDQN